LPPLTAWRTLPEVEAPYLGEDAVVLRSLHEDDVDALVDLGRDPLFTRWVDAPAAADDAAGERSAATAFVAQARAGWAQESRFTLAVEVEGRCAGTVALHPDGAGAARVGCALSPWARGRGAASAAVRLALTWAFVEQGAALVQWRAEVGNWPARRVAWACGMTTEGTVRSLLVRHAERVDAWVGSVRWDEPLEPRSPWLAPVPLTGRAGSTTAVLDGLGVEDVGRVAQACSAPVVQAWLPELPSPYTVADAIAFVATREEEHAGGRGVYWAVRDRRGGPLTGTVALFRLAPGGRSGEVGYWVHPEAAGRGVATAAVRAVAGHALSPTSAGGLGLARLVLRASRGNLASRRVAIKAGFAPVGVERDAERLRDGTVTDLLVHDAVASAGGTATAGGGAGAGAGAGAGDTVNHP
jgi:RimJ/RimL family protein N-acetyltransferase